VDAGQAPTPREELLLRAVVRLLANGGAVVLLAVAIVGDGGVIPCDL
jgi:hypothetical protein